MLSLQLVMHDAAQLRTVLSWDRDEMNPQRSEMRRGLRGKQPASWRSTFLGGDEDFEQFDVVNILDCGKHLNSVFPFFSVIIILIIAYRKV